MAENSDETVELEFFDLDTGEVRFAVELTRKDLEGYQLAAQNLGVTFEDFMLQIAEAQLHEENTQWFAPRVDSNGDITLEGAAPVEIPTATEISRGKAEQVGAD